MWMRKAPVLALLGLAAVGCASNGPPPPSAPSPLADTKAPTFARDTLAGGRIDTATLGGKVTVVKFFAEYCEPCKRTLPAAQELHEKMGDVAFVGVSEDERSEDALSLVRTYGLTFPVVLDRGNVLAGRFRVSELPVTFVIDAAGTVAWVGGPGHDEKALERAVRAVKAR